MKTVDSTTGGYWETAANGGVFAYGAPFAGSMGASTLSKPIVGISASASNYELVGGDGGGPDGHEHLTWSWLGDRDDLAGQAGRVLASGAHRVHGAG